MRRTNKSEAPGRLALVERFVNTQDINADGNVEGLTDPRTLQEWLIDQGLLESGESLGEEDLRRARAVREALRALLLAHTTHAEPDSAALAVVNEAGARGALRVQAGSDGGAHLVAAANGVDGALGQLMAIVHEADHQGLWQSLKACSNEDCRWAFFDRSKNQSGLWCAMSVCGNRAKIRAYRSRRRLGSDS